MRNKWSILIIFLFLSSLFLIFDTTNAQQVKDPGASKAESFCFTKKECFSRREEQGATEPKKESAFYTGSDTDICNPLEEDKEMGFCLPAGQASTQVEFAGTDQFANVGEFIQFIYKWSMTAGAILAVLVILISGIQWTISMGNQSVIKKAKSRIAGAIAGIALLASSYLILNTINPALVNMRLPQTWMVKEQETPTAKGKGVCDHTKNNENDQNPDCSEGQICVALGAGDFSEGACNKLAVASVLAPLAMWGASSAAAATVQGGGAAGLMSQGLQATGAKIAEFSIPSVSGAVKGIYTGTKVVVVNGAKATALATAAGVEEATLGLGSKGLKLADETYNQVMSSGKGVCLQEPAGRKEGQFCTPGKNQCADDLNCVKDDVVSGMTECWTGEATGFCSDGSNHGSCNSNDDCNDGHKCIRQAGTEIGGNLLQVCSNGEKGSPCGQPEVCNEDLECIGGRCVGKEMKKPGEICIQDDKCTGDTSLGWNYASYCWNYSNDGKLYHMPKPIELRGGDFATGICAKGEKTAPQQITPLEPKKVEKWFEDATEVLKISTGKTGEARSAGTR